MKKLKLEEIRSIQIEILNAIDDHCRQENIRYSLFFGTLLGAVRHGGYIPWDDDIDLMMPRPDYDRFVESFDKDKTRFRVRSLASDPNCPFTFAKVENPKTKLVEHSSIPFDMGVNVDVFPMDGVPDDEQTFDKFFRRLKLYRDALTVKFVRVDFRGRSLIRNSLLIILKALVAVIPYRILVHKIDQLSRSWEFKECNSAMVSCVHDNKQIHRADRSNYESFVEMSFEGRGYRCVENHDAYLARQYGDYMKLPPVDARVTHHKYEVFFR